MKDRSHEKDSRRERDRASRIILGLPTDVHKRAVHYDREI